MYIVIHKYGAEFMVQLFSRQEKELYHSSRNIDGTYFVAEQRDCPHDCLLQENQLFQALGYLLVNLQEIYLQFEA
jgi:hypothetical protein